MITPLTFAILPVIPYRVYARPRSSSGKVEAINRYAEGTKAAPAMPDSARRTRNEYISTKKDKMRLMIVKPKAP